MTEFRPGGAALLALVGCFVAGVGGLLLAIVSITQDQPVAAGLGLIAAACAFGQLVNAAYRR